METPADPPVVVRSRWTFRRVFRWGVVFWIAAWIFSICWSQTLYLEVKGLRKIMIECKYGALNFEYYGTTATGGNFSFKQDGFIWSKVAKSLIRQNPNSIYRLITNANWHFSDSGTSVTIPLAGILWLWLAGGWFGELKRFRRAIPAPTQCSPIASGSRLRIIGLTASLVVIAVGIPLAVRIGNIAISESSCAYKIDLIQSRIRGYYHDQGLFNGEAIDWPKISSPMLRAEPSAFECPAGGAYQLSPVQPISGEPAASCPHPEHQKFLKTLDTSRW